MSNIKEICKKYRNDPKECINQLRALKPTPSIVGQWAFYAASIGYHEVFRACWKSVEHALNARRSTEHTQSGLLMNACVGGHPQIVECVARAYAQDINNAYEMVEHCAKTGKKDILDVLLTLGEELNVFAWKPTRIIKECFKSHQNTTASEYLNRYSDKISPGANFAQDCCTMGNIEGLVLLHDFCKNNPHVSWASTWRASIEEACKNQRVELVDFLLGEGVKLFTQPPNTETYFLGAANAAYWARNVSAYNQTKAEEMLKVVFKNVAFETWKDKVSASSLSWMEQRYTQYLRATIEENIDVSQNASNRRKI